MRIITAKDFGKLMRNARRKAKLTQTQLAAVNSNGVMHDLSLPTSAIRSVDLGSFMTYGLIFRDCR